MIQVTMQDYTLHLAERMPDRDDGGCAHAALVEQFGNDSQHERGDEPSVDDLLELHVEVQQGSTQPFLCVTQRYARLGGWHPGVLLVPETAVLFIGAGERLLAYDLHGPLRLWADQADTGFHGWQRYDDLVVMSAELELAAWDVRGVKQWSTFVEPPWDYHVDGSMVHLNVMGVLSLFPLVSGPARP